MIPVIILLIFAVAGIGMIIGSFAVLKMEKSITDGAVEITAHITDIQPGDPIEVAVNPNNYKHYHVKAEERINQRVVDYT